MPKSRLEIVGRIGKEIERLVTEFYSSEGMLGPRMFIELSQAEQWHVLSHHVNWTGLTGKEKAEVMERALRDVREKVPEEIYPATWFDGVLIRVDRDQKVLDLETLRKEIDTPGRDKNLNERIPSKDKGIER